MTNFTEWPTWQRMVAIAVGVCAIVMLVQLPDAGASGCKAPLPYRLACTGYSIASDAVDGITSVSKSGKNTAKAAENTTSGVASATGGAAKLLDKLNNGIDHIGEAWNKAKNATTSSTTPLPPIHVIPVAPSAPAPRTTAVPVIPPTSTTLPRIVTHRPAIVAPDGTRYAQGQ